jgi:hypothetical protein
MKITGRFLLLVAPVSLEPLTEGTWNVFLGPVNLGWLDEPDYRIHDHRAAAANCHPSGENSCHLSFEMFTSPNDCGPGSCI